VIEALFQWKQDAPEPGVQFWFPAIAKSLNQYLPSIFSNVNLIMLKENVTNEELHMSESQRSNAEKQGPGK
jgi:hypothetical protein